MDYKTFKAVVVMRWELFGIVHNCLGLIIQPAFMHQFDLNTTQTFERLEENVHPFVFIC